MKKGMTSEETAPTVIRDVRLEYLGGIVQNLLRVSEEKWLKLIQSEDARIQITTKFLDDPDSEVALVSECGSGGSLVICLAAGSLPSSRQQQKVVYFLKGQGTVVTPENVKEVITCGDLSSVTVEHLQAFLDYAVVPTLCNPTCHEGWSRESAADLLGSVRSFRGLVARAVAQNRGHVIITVPPLQPFQIAVFARSEGVLTDAKSSWIRESVSVLECSVHQWSEQIQEVLEQKLEGSSQYHPEPAHHYKFWCRRGKSLRFIRDQLRSDALKVVAEILHTASSPSDVHLQQLIRLVEDAVKEAEDIEMHLISLYLRCKDLEAKDLPRLRHNLVDGLLRMVKEAVENCISLQQPHNASIVNQIYASIANILVHLSQQFLDGATLFRGELDDSEQRLDLVLIIMDHLRRSRIDNDAFTIREQNDRLEMFVKRLKSIKVVFETASAFLRLVKTEIGGIHGHATACQIRNIYDEFQEQLVVFDKCPYDILEPDAKDFQNDIELFHRRIADLDERLGSIIKGCVLSCSSAEAMSKVLQVCEFLLKRPSIRDVALSACEKHVLDTAGREMDSLLMKFLEEVKKDKASLLPVHLSLPQTSRIIQWVTDIKEMLNFTKQSIDDTSHLFISKKVVESLSLKHDKLSSTFTKLSDETFEQWASYIPKLLQEKLHTPLIKRLDDGSIAENFSSKLEVLIHEVKHLLRLKNEADLPAAAVAFYRDRDRLGEQRIMLRVFIDCYNDLREDLVSIEVPLLEPAFRQMDELLAPGESNVLWSGANVLAYLQEIESSSKSIHSKVQTSKQNLRKIQSVCSRWACSEPMLDEASLPLDLSTLESAEKLVNEKLHQKVNDDALKIFHLIEENKILFDVPDSNKAWKNYIECVDEMVTNGLLGLIQQNLQFFLQSSSSSNDKPVFMIHTYINDQKELLFKPPLYQPAEFSVQGLIENLIDGIFEVAALFPRINTDHPQTQYISEFQGFHELQNMREELRNRVEASIRDTEEVLLDLQPFAYLWKEEPEGIVKSLTATTDDSLGNVPQIIEQIRHCGSLRNQVSEGIRIYRLVRGWLRVDQLRFLNHLLSRVDWWKSRFQELVAEGVNRCIEELDEFCKVTGAELKDISNCDQMDSSTLLRIITRIQAVQDRKTNTDALFAQLATAVKFLSNECNKTLDDEIQELMITLPDRWQHTKKLSEVWRQQISTPIAIEASSVRKQVAAFSSKQIQFRENFRKSCAFRRDCPQPPEKMLNKLRDDIAELRKEVLELSKSGKLFEVHVPEFTQLKQCENELGLLEELWQYIATVKVQLQQWEATPWTKVDLDALEMQCKAYMRDIKSMDKEMRSWDNFLWLQETIKNILVALRAIHQLRNPAIKDRHWTQLSAATQVPLAVDQMTPLGELLSLELHRFEDVVEGIVERASKELATERILAELEATWAAILFEKASHPRTGHTLLHISDALVATLEDNQVQLQNLMSSRHVAHFADRISEWARRLSQVESVVGAWIEVQRAWAQMESIFMGSEDIKDQLPDDCERFMSIDASFKRLVNVLSAESETVVSVSDREEVHKDLSHLQTELALCEKALASYLETKRRIFPRFYFVSSADLLDILSNGTRPRIVVRHLPKLFDSVGKLRFPSESDDTTDAVISRDGEIVPLKEPCSCRGPVESWLGRLLNAIGITLKEALAAALSTYEDGNRESWIFENAAQVALTGTQIWWAAEVSAALQRVRQGHEIALKQYHKKQMQQLHHLIGLLLTELTADCRQKVMTICTMDVHARDVVARLVAQKVENETDFAWQSQLRHRWEDEDCRVHICDARFDYDHEYLGNTPRLVVTPLTDRCFITLTQSLKLMIGGAPTGPAGTGKTETVKDLGRALGTLVYVFNCSEQMDYRSCANIYKGLAQTGAWGCFDEFNRISVEVLSVVAVQVKCVQDALRAHKPSLCLLGDDIPLKPTLGIFITMNPGYAGRTELPENLKTLFRPCAMVAPDIQLICEILLVAEGFVEARSLGQKFTTLYSLCKQLLSLQHHYDWGLRAIKSVLVVAGSLKRASPASPEEHILMLALRDFNLPKIVSEDVGVFLGLIGDLFPALDVPRKKNPVLEKSVREAIAELKFQAEDNFVLKVLQLSDLLSVRHSVFLVGAAGSGKSSVCKTLLEVHRHEKPLAFHLNPKVVTNDELFGTINPATREWKDGLLSSLIRDLVNASTDGPRWLILDGDIDPMWIESLNSVMDDNRVLTLASRERISLTPTMRLLFEVSNLEKATPATVSRGGVLYLDPSDVGWNPYAVSWIERRIVQSEKANLIIFFDKYVPPCLEALNKRFKTVIHVPDICYVQTLCRLLECLLTPENTPPDSPNELYELYFVFCCVWAFGSALDVNGQTDTRLEFSNWFLSEFKSVKFPISGSQAGAEASSVFDYYIENRRFYPWTRKLQKFQPAADVSLQNTLVPTKETHRIQYLLNILLEKGYPIMLVGPAGCGKTSVVRSILGALDQDSEYLVVNVPFSFYTTSAAVQRAMEMHLEKKVGKNFGPPGQKKIIYFIDDFNVPEVDMYGTCQPHTIIRQHLDYGHWYDRIKLTLKEVTNCQYIACMCPTAGSCTINSRLQRHFCVLSVPPSSVDSMQSIFGVQFREHLRRIHPDDDGGEFRPALQQQIVRLAVALHGRIVSAFRPTAVKFHYLFNLRDVANVFKGLMLSSTESLTKGEDLLPLWLHESQRVYRDKLLDQDDLEKFDKILADELKRNAEFDDQGANSTVSKIPIHCHFAQGIGTSCYQPINDYKQLTRLIQDALDAYNEIYPPMDLVLFEDAVKHVCRITRILESNGHALLIGVGGSGRQSLASLAAYICNLHLHQPTLHQDYDLQDFKNDIGGLYLRAGVKNIGSLFLVSDAQVVDERFLVLINDLLSSGDIPDLFPEAEVENIVSALRSEVKSAGIFDSRDNCWNYFINKVKRKLRVVLCFSPAGSTLRSRSRKFPTLISCTCIDWFHLWPKEALVTVCNKFLEDLPILKPHLRDSVADFVAYAYRSVNEVSKIYLRKERRHNETTPKSFLQHIKTYNVLMQRRSNFLEANVNRLEVGLQRLVETSQQVDILKEQLANQEIELQRRSVDIDALLADVETEKEHVSHERNVAAGEEEKVSRIHSEVAKRQRDCEQDLAEAEPALIAAQEALNTLNKNNLTELRSFGSPPVAVRNVTSAVMVLLATDGKIPKDLSWRAAKLTMSKVDNFLDSLINFDKNHIHENSIRAVQTYLRSPEFKPEVVEAKSQAAAGLCSWVINVLKYYEVYCNVEPKRRALAEANAEYQVAKDKLAKIQEKVAEVESRLNELQARCDAASEAKTRCESEAQRTAFSLNLANRLLGGLASERQRWSALATRFRELENSLAGDVLLASAFVAYLGPFTAPYRRQLQQEYWRPFLESKSNLDVGANTDDSCLWGLMVSLLLEDETIVGRWRNHGLPGDLSSVENAAIYNSSFYIWRWPLIIDPQVQAIPWIRNTYGERTIFVRTDQKGYLDKIEEAIVAGQVVVVENLEENIDPRLYPIIFHNFVKKGKAIKLGNKEIPFHSEFRLILHTKLSNPRYGPEIQAQTTIINFGVTTEGLADQLLAEVVSKERPDLEEAKALLTKQQSEFAVILKELEESLLSRLSEAEGDLVGDVALVESLEQTKTTAAEVQARDEEARANETKIDDARGVYRDVAERAALVYFVVQDMVTLSTMYLFSLKSIKEVFHKAIDRCEQTMDVTLRVSLLVDSVTLAIFSYVSRGLFENHKTVFAAHLTFQILSLREPIPVEVTEFLLHQNLEESNLESPVDFMNAQAWAAVRLLSSLDEFQGLDRDMEASPKRWRKLLDSEFPEKEPLPQEWKNKSTPFHKLCILRCLRPDRVLYAIRDFVSDVLGPDFIGGRVADLDCVLSEWGSARTPLLFILSPGVDPLHDLEACTSAPSQIQNVSLGQGQETIAEQTMDDAMNEGQWVVLQNIHLAKGWLHRLERKLENLETVPVHSDFRLFLSANPPEEGGKLIPPGVLEACLKVTNEPPKGMKANLHKALDNFSQETFDSSSRETEFKSLLFTLCYFHAVLTERKKFSSQGWNYPYPFNDSDILISASVLQNHLDTDGGRAATIPWDDLRFLFGEIMYGGHITDDRDRKICSAYLKKFFNNEQLEPDYPLCPGFGMPPILDYEGYHKYIENHLPGESPVLYGLHPNAEVGCLTDASNNLLRALHLLEPSRVTEPSHDMPLNNNPNECAVVAASNEEKIHQVAEDITDKLPSPFPLADLQGRVTEDGSISPFAAVGLQECERMNNLLEEIRRSLRDIDHGLKGELPWNEEMEILGDSLVSDAVPRLWASKAYPSLLPLGSWFTDLLQRYRALDKWVNAELSVLPPVIWLGGLFSPQSFLTAVIQTSGRKHDQPLDKLALHCEVTKKNPEDCAMAPREGANIAGLYMEGGRWDFSTGCIMDPLMKDLHPSMPVVCLRAVLADKVDIRSAYLCPVYRTRQRGDTFIWEFPLKSSVPPDKWIIAGTALLLQI